MLALTHGVLHALLRCVGITLPDTRLARAHSAGTAIRGHV